MAAPQFVPENPTHRPRDYASPPRRMDPWFSDRPGDLVGPVDQPDVDAGRMGAPGPDQGYALKLVGLLRPELVLHEREDPDDAEAGIVAVGLKRASLYGRAPILADLRVAATIWGFLDGAAPAELVEERTRRFEGIRHTAHHYPELRAVADAVPAEALRRSPDDVAAAHRADWRSLLDL